MKRIHAITAVAALAALLAGPVHAQQGSDSDATIRAGAVPPNPVAALLAQRDEIGLTAQQATALARMARVLDERNQALAGHLSPAAGGGRSKDEDRRKRAEQRASYDEVIANTRRAAADARTILTPEQRRRADLLARHGRP